MIEKPEFWHRMNRALFSLRKHKEEIEALFKLATKELDALKKQSIENPLLTPLPSEPVWARWLHSNWKLHIRTAGELCAMSERELRRHKGIGATTVSKAKAWLAELGLKLKEDNA